MPWNRAASRSWKNGWYVVSAFFFSCCSAVAARTEGRGSQDPPAKARPEGSRRPPADDPGRPRAGPAPPLLGLEVQLLDLAAQAAGSLLLAAIPAGRPGSAGPGTASGSGGRATLTATSEATAGCRRVHFQAFSHAGVGRVWMGRPSWKRRSSSASSSALGKRLERVLLQALEADQLQVARHLAAPVARGGTGS